MGTIKKICVCGAGTMGSGIAQVAAQSGFTVILFDVHEEMFEKSNASIHKSLQKFVDKGKLTATAKEETLQRISFTHKIENCIADVIIEAIVEQKKSKENLFDALAELNDDNTIFATNTSSISVSALSRHKNYAERFAGMHFFNPAQVMKLVEVVSAENTSPKTIKTLIQLATDFNKIPVICNDAPGFIVNRVARHYYLEALRLVENGDADVGTIDAVMEATGFKMGPFRLMDLIGIDINYSVSVIVWEALNKPERLQPSSLQKDKVEANELGRKTGKGFYNY